MWLSRNAPPPRAVSRRSARHQRRRRRQRLTGRLLLTFAALLGVVLISSPFGLTGSGLAAITTTSNTVNSGPWPTSTWNAGSTTFNDTSDGTVTLNAVGNTNLPAYCVSANYTGTNPTSGWSDPFNGTSLDNSKWIDYTGGNASVVSGELKINANAGVWAEVPTASAADMTHASAATQVTTLPGGNGQAWLEVFKNNGAGGIDWSNGVWIYNSADKSHLVMGQYINNSAVNTLEVAYNATTMAYWRILVNSPTVNFQTSPDGSTWTTRHTVTTPLDFSSAFSVIETGSWTTVAAPTYATFDNFTVTQYTHSAFSASTSGALAANLNLTVEKGSGGGNGSCTGFTPTATLYTGAMSGLPTTFATGLDHVNNPVSATVYRFSGTVPSLTTQRGSATFTWHAQVGTNTTSTWSADRLTYNDTTDDTLTLNTLGTGNITPYCLSTNYTGTNPTSGWSDPFDTIDTNRWVNGTGGLGSINGGQLKLFTRNSYPRLVTAAVNNFLNTQVSVKVPSVPGATSVTGLELRVDNATLSGDEFNRLGIFYSTLNNALNFQEIVSGVSTSSTKAWNPATMAYWRIVSAGQNITFQYSADGIIWSTGWTKTTTLNLAALKYNLTTGTGTTASAPDYATFDDFIVTTYTHSAFSATTTGALASDVNLTVEKGSGGGNGSCTGFTPSATVYTGTLTGLPSSFATGLDDTNNPPAATVYRISGTITPTSTKRSTTTFTWHAQVGANTASTWSADRLSYNDSTSGSLTLNSVGSGNIPSYCLATTWQATGYFDDFSTINTTSQWYNDSPAAVTSTGSVVNFAVSNNSYGYLISKNPFNATNTTVTIEIMSTPGPDANMGLGIRRGTSPTNTDLNNRLAMYYDTQNNKLYMNEVVGGVLNSTNVVWSAAAMKFWRINVAGTTVTWQYSGDAQSWTTGKTVNNTSLNLTSVYHTVSAGSESSTSAPRFAQFDNFRFTRHSQSKFYATSTGTLAGDVNLTIERGTGGASGSCTGFTPSATVYTGTLPALPSTFAAGLDPLNLTSTPQTITYRISGTVSPTSTKRSTTTLTWQSQAS